MIKYVQHISGQGKKWEVIESAETHEHEWNVKANRHGVRSNMHWLPKSEYHEVPAPAAWVDVTELCEVRDDYDCQRVYHDGASIHHMFPRADYRLRKVEVNMVGPGVTHGCKKQWAFIVERKA